MVLRRYEIALAHLSAALDINMSPHGIQISLLHLLRWYCNSKWKRNYTTQPDLALTLFANHDGRHIGAGYILDLHNDFRRAIRRLALEDDLATDGFGQGKDPLRYPRSRASSSSAKALVIGWPVRSSTNLHSPAGLISRNTYEPSGLRRKSMAP